MSGERNEHLILAWKAKFRQLTDDGLRLAWMGEMLISTSDSYRAALSEELKRRGGERWEALEGGTT